MASHSQHEHHVPSIAHYVGVFAALMVLTAATVGVASLDLGRLNTIVALSVAGVKAFLVMYIFMELRNAPSLTRLAAMTGIVFLAILLIMVGQDYGARTVLHDPPNWGKTLPIDQNAPVTATPAAPAAHAPAH